MNSFKIFDKNDNFKKYKHIKSNIVWGGCVEKTDISTMIPAFKRGDLLAKTIENVLAQKTIYNFEICVVDNDDSVDSLSV